MPSRSRALRILLVAVPVVAAGVALAQRPRVEEAIRARIEREAAERGLVADVVGVHVGPWPPLSLTGVRLEKPGAWSAATNTVSVTVGPWGRSLRVSTEALALSGPGGAAADVEPATWEIARSAGDAIQVALRAPFEGVTATWIPAADGGRVEGTFAEAPVGRLVTVRRNGLPLLDAGVVGGTVRIGTSREELRFDLDLAGHGVRLAALDREDVLQAPEAEFGDPTDVKVRVEGSWQPGPGDLDVRRWHLDVSGATLSGTVAVRDARGQASLDVSLDAERVDFGRLFRTSGVARVETITVSGEGGDLGSASLAARFRGRLADPGSFTVTQDLDFTPPARMPRAIARLRGPFIHEVPEPGLGPLRIEVYPTSPDFIALGDVPPLFVRTLLLAEDAGFYGHRGLDLGELPSAVLTNWARGQPARGASTITQQLAKNLFLSRDKRMGRKLQELSLALLLESALGKQRILEIYLNVIEWGPGLHGLRPAAHRYFHKEPQELTPRQMAFLVALIPGPIKYQRSFARGTLSPGFRPLVDELLAKVHSVDALSEEEYQAALAEELVVDTAGFISTGR